MKKSILLLILLSVLFSQPVVGEVFNPEPTQTIFKSSVANVTIVDSFFITANPRGLSVFVYRANLQAYNFISSFNLDIDSCQAKLYDSILVISENNSNRIFFVDVKQLPELNLLGEIALSHDFSDFVLADNELYVSNYFEGVFKYTLNSFSSASFADSSMLGILNTQMELDGDTLYVLDEYNGIIRFDLTTPGFGEFIDYLYIPHRAASFKKMDSLYVVMLNDDGIYLSDFNSFEAPEIIDSIYNITRPQNIFYTDSILLVLNRNDMIAYERKQLSPIKIYDIDFNLTRGQTYIRDGVEYLMLPLTTGGVTLFDLTYDSAPIQGLSHTSRITDLDIQSNQLFMSGPSEAVKVLSFKESGMLTIDYKILENFDNSSYFDRVGDSLFVLAPNHNLIAFILNADNPDSAYIINTMPYEGAAKDIFYNQSLINNLNLLLIQKQNSIQVFLVGLNGAIYDKGDWNFITNISHMTITDSTLFVTTQKNEMLVYRINNYFNLSYVAGYSLTGNSTDMYLSDTTIFVAENEKVHTFRNHSDGSISRGLTYYLGTSVRDMKFYNDYLYTIGYEGIAIYSLLDFYPTLEQLGGLPGNMIEVNNDYIITTDGDGLLVYEINTPPIDDSPGEDNDSLSSYIDISNYPNPFNGETRINFHLPAAAEVSLEVYNLLGQKVKTLLSGFQSGGDYQISWGGTDENHQSVSSGIYFYRLTLLNDKHIGKMIFLK